MDDIAATRDRINGILDLSYRASTFIRSLENAAMDEDGSLEYYHPEMKREEYSPIFARMTPQERQTYFKLSEEFADHSARAGLWSNLDETIRLKSMQGIIESGLQLNELFAKVAFRSKLFSLEDMTAQWPRTSSGEADAQHLKNHGSRMLAVITKKASRDLTPQELS